MARLARVDNTELQHVKKVAFDVVTHCVVIFSSFSFAVRPIETTTDLFN
jgi:hypothetical protein